MTVTATGVLFSLRRLIMLKAAVMLASTARQVPSKRISRTSADSLPKRNSGLAITTTPVRVIAPVMICSRVKGSFRRKYAKMVTKTGEAKWMVEASESGIRR